MNTRNASNVDYEMAQWHKLYKSIEENVRREILMDVNDKMNKLKRKNRKLKDQNKCLMEMMSMMRTPSASRFVPHTPSGLCTPVLEPVQVASKEPVQVASKEPVQVASKEAAQMASKEAAEVKVIHVKVEKVSTKNNITIDLCDNVQNEIVLKKELVAPPVVVIDKPEEEEQEEQEELEQEEEEVDEQEEEEQEEELEEVEVEEEEQEEQEEQEEVEEEEVEEQEELEQQEEPKQVITAEVAKVVEPEEEEEEESVEEVFINNKRYYTTNLLNGVIYDIDEEDNPGNEVGKIVDGKPILKVAPAAVPVAVPEEEEEEEEESVEEWEFEDDKYYVSNTKDGKIYLMTKDEEVGDEIGKFVNGKPIFYD